MADPQRRAALDEWAREVLPRAVAYARSLVRDAHQAEDVVQECLMRLLRHEGEYDLVRDGVKLLFRAVSNLCINQTTRRRALASLDTGGEDDGPLPVEDRLARMPVEELQQRELLQAVQAAMAKLPPLQRAALELRALGQGKTEIAEALQVSESNAGVLVFRARQALAKELGPLLGEES